MDEIETPILFHTSLFLITHVYCPLQTVYHSPHSSSAPLFFFLLAEFALARTEEAAETAGGRLAGGVEAVVGER